MKIISSERGNLVNISYYKSILAITLIFATFVSFLIFSLSNFLSINLYNDLEMVNFLKIISFILVPFTLLKINSRVAQGYQNLSIFAFLHIAIIPILHIIFFSFIYLLDKNIFVNLPIVSRSFAYFSSSVISFFILCKLPLIDLDQFFLNKNTLNKDLLKKMLVDSNPFMFNEIFYFLSMGVGLFLVSYFTNPYELGLYSVPFRIAAYLSIFITALNSFIHPNISKFWAQKNYSAIKNIYFTSSLILFTVTTFFVFLIFIFSEQILNIFGSDFLTANSCLIFLIIAQWMNSLFGPMDALLDMTDNQKLVRNNLALNVLINFVLGIILIPILGIVGAAISFIISRMVYLLIQAFYVKKHIGFMPLLFFVKKLI